MTHSQACCAGVAGRGLGSGFGGTTDEASPALADAVRSGGSWCAGGGRVRPRSHAPGELSGGPWTNLTAGGILPLPPPPPQGDFYQVIFANPKWMVVQNRAGAQFPIAADFIAQFLIRWRGDVSDLIDRRFWLSSKPWARSMGIIDFADKSY